MKPPKLLVDADYFLYRAAAAAELELEYNPDLTVIVGDFMEGRRIVKQEWRNLRQRFDTDDLLLCFTDTTNFRKTIDPDYKGSRKDKRKPAGYKKLKEWCMATWPSVIKPGLEADDVLGILATKGDIDNFVLVSPDKDMLQIPCRIYNLKDEFTQDSESAMMKLWEQCLTGDSTDGYKGCKSVGPKKAEQILEKVKDGNYWKVIVETYEKAGQTEEDALRNLRLARILQAEDWDKENQAPILYSPYETTTSSSDKANA